MPLPNNASHRSELTMAILSITIVILISDLSKPLTLLVTTFRVPLSQQPGDFRNVLNQRIQENRNVGAIRKISALLASETLDDSLSLFVKGSSMSVRMPLRLYRSVRGYPPE